MCVDTVTSKESTTVQPMFRTAFKLVLLAIIADYVLQNHWLLTLSALAFSVWAVSALSALFIDCMLPRSLVVKDFIGREELAVFVTGCDRGFGNLCTRHLDKLGFSVFAGFLDAKGVEAQKLKKESSNRLTVVQCDVTDDQEVLDAAKTVKEALGEKVLIAIVNNAGVMYTSWIELTPLERYRTLFDTNCLGAIRVTKAFLPLLARGQQRQRLEELATSARVVVMASNAGRVFIPFLSAYSVSKAGILAFADTLRLEMAQYNVTVHTIEPITYNTGMVNLTSFEKEWLDNWNNIGSTGQTHLDESFLQKSLRHFLYVLTKSALPQSRLYEVVDDLVHCAVGHAPLDSYQPNFLARIRCLFYQLIPRAFQDYIITRRLIPSR